MFTCEECGYSREVELTDDEGRPVAVAEYVEALHVLGRRLLCSECAGAAADGSRVAE